MLTQVDAAQPTLQAPGSGLPTPELWIARLIVGCRARLTTRAGAAALFARERQTIVRMATDVSPEAGRRRVLINRLRGMEDSSRFWSIYMTLDHLRIVNEGTTALIGQLVCGELPQRIVGTADVKPSPSANVEVINKFEHACDRFQQSVATVSNLHTELRWPHPWFGPLSAAKWHFFTAFHMSLHRRQIEAIQRAHGVPG